MTHPSPYHMFVKPVLAALAIAVGATLTTPAAGSAVLVAPEYTLREAIVPVPSPVLTVSASRGVAAPIAIACQTPPDEQNPWLCYDVDGWERPCTATETFDRCLRASADSYEQCIAKNDSWWAEALCGAKRDINSNACLQDYLSTQWPW